MPDAIRVFIENDYSQGNVRMHGVIYGKLLLIP